MHCKGFGEKFRDLGRCCLSPFGDFCRRYTKIFCLLRIPVGETNVAFRTIYKTKAKHMFIPINLGSE